jgi:hypothetical protein
MRTLTAVFAVSMILMAFATTSYKVIAPMNTKQSRNIVAVLTQVENMMKSGGPIEMVHDVLSEFENEITSEQSAHDGLNEQASAECEKESDFRRREVADAVSTLREAEATLGGCQDQTRRANSDLKSANSALIETRNRLAILGERRQQEAATFSADQTLYEFSTANVTEVIEFLDALLAGEGEFTELAQKGEKLMRAAIKSNKVGEYGSAFAVLAALANKNTQADAELFEQARNIFENLSEALEANWVERVVLEDHLIAQNEASVASTEQIIAELIQHIENLNIELVNLNRCIVIQTGVVGTATAKRDRNQRLWDDSNELCGSQAEFYEQSKNQRREERDIIDAVRQKVNIRWG